MNDYFRAIFFILVITTAFRYNHSKYEDSFVLCKEKRGKFLDRPRNLPASFHNIFLPIRDTCLLTPQPHYLRSGLTGNSSSRADFSISISKWTTLPYLCLGGNHIDALPFSYKALFRDMEFPETTL